MAGMRSNLFDPAHQEKATGERFSLQNNRMLRVQLGPDVLALKGSMVAYQGTAEFHHEGAGSIGKLMKRVLTSEDTPLMRVRGQGEVFFANTAQNIFLVHLEGDAVSVNGTNLLAFDANLDWDVRRVKGAGIAAGGLFNTEISGQGTVALTADGDPVLLDCSQVPTYVDVQAAVAWSANLQPSVVSSVNVRSLLRGGTGEAAQYHFHGPGFVVVQPSEGRPVAESGGSSGGGAGGLFDG
jgi:uncharacterized protein (AIM24 family)